MKFLIVGLCVGGKSHAHNTCVEGGRELSGAGSLSLYPVVRRSLSPRQPCYLLQGKLPKSFQAVLLSSRGRWAPDAHCTPALFPGTELRLSGLPSKHCYAEPSASPLSGIIQ